MKNLLLPPCSGASRVSQQGPSSSRSSSHFHVLSSVMLPALLPLTSNFCLDSFTQIRRPIPSRKGAQSPWCPTVVTPMSLTLSVSLFFSIFSLSVLYFLSAPFGWNVATHNPLSTLTLRRNLCHRIRAERRYISGSPKSAPDPKLF